MYLTYKLFSYYSVDNTTVSDYSDDESENNENSTSNLTLTNSTAYYRNLYSELMLSYEANRDNTNNDTKSVAFKKKNISQMGRKKANRALNGISIYCCTYIHIFFYLSIYNKLPSSCIQNKIVSTFCYQNDNYCSYVIKHFMNIQ